MEVVQKMMKEGGNEEDLAKLMASMGGNMPGGGAGEPNVSTYTFTHIYILMYVVYQSSTAWLQILRSHDRIICLCSLYMLISNACGRVKQISLVVLVLKLAMLCGQHLADAHCYYACSLLI
jgi:hypothetical protein